MRRLTRTIATLGVTAGLAVGTAGVVGASVSAIPATASAAMASSTSNEPADSGFCGVRVQGPTPIPPNLIWAYTWRNKCSFTVSEKLYFPSNGHTTGCYTLSPLAYATAYVGVYDPNWTIVNC